MFHVVARSNKLYGLAIKKNGKILPWWYADYVRANGKRTVVNLNIKMEGSPPKSGKVADQGSPKFEKSRRAAAVKLDELRKEGTGARVTKREALRNYIEQVKEPLDIPALDALLTARAGEAKKRSRESLSGDQAKLLEFVEWAKGRGLKTVMDITLGVGAYVHP